MVSANDSDHYTATNFNNVSSALPVRHKFTTAGQTTFTAIDKELVKRFNIDDTTWNYQYATESGIFIAFRKDQKNRAAEQ